MTTLFPNSLADLRTSYEQFQLLEQHIASTPMAQFSIWLQHAIAAKTLEPNAMTLSTVGQNAHGIWRPSSRIVLVKGVDEDGLTWFTNYQSRKGLELATNPYASLQFHWIELERQVRLEGRVEKLSDTENAAYFHSRPLGSRIGAWASPQSQVIIDRETLENTEINLRKQLGESPACPPHWGGYRLRPDTVEFWQGRPNRLHDRLRYTLNNTNDETSKHTWLIERLAP